MFQMDKIDIFFEAQHLRAPEKKEVRAFMALGFSFEESFFKVEERFRKDFTDPDGEVPTEVESFSTTATWLREGVISLDKPSRLSECE